MIRAEPQDLVEYVAEFDLALSDLTPEQASMFVAARNAAQHVEGLEVPVGSPDTDRSDTDLAERETDRVLDLTACDDASCESRLPADEMDVSLIRSTEDLPRILPVQWLFEETWPDLFYAKVAQRELLVPEWQRPTRGPRGLWDEAPERELLEQQAAAESAKLHAYVLLDTSSTMQDHDRRGTVARGLALEFLRKGCRQGARLHLRPFAVEVGELSSGTGREDLLAITRRVIGLPNFGQTRIQTALEQAVRDIRSEGPCLGAGILLITDGISRLSKNPLAGEKLHTLVLGDLFDQQRAAGAIETLKEWSHTFHRIWKTWFAELLAPRWTDCEAAGQLLQSLLDDCGGDPSGPEAGKLRRLLENVRALVKEFKRSLGRRAAIPPEVRALESRLKDLEQRLVKAAEQATPADAQQTSDSQQGPVSRGRAAKGSAHFSREKMGLVEFLARLAIQAWQWARGLCHAWFRRGR